MPSSSFTCPKCGTVNRRDDPLRRFCPCCDAFTGRCAAGWEVRCSGILCPPVSRSRENIDHWMAWHLECAGLGSEEREVEAADGQRVTKRFCPPHARRLDEAKPRTLQLAVTDLAGRRA